MSQPTSREEQRDRLLEAALVHVPFDGWSRRALVAGAADLGVEPGVARRLFPRAGDDMLAHLERWADRRMLAGVGLLDGLRVRDRIARLVRARLEALDPHREAMRRATAARLLPSNALAACGSLWRTVDLMWVTAGDNARDPSYYSKRSLLAAVWTSTFLFWLDDRSEGSAATAAFLERRIDNVMQIGRLRGRVDDLLHGLARFNPLAAQR
ncbi:MAG TPA: COQ9 family protein [Geminicoccaceae bacterium]|jgi:ubiquinone biosynthesis protein COQ9|nr:COQ9 family protein [Geminicoccaceae bacterium]